MSCFLCLGRAWKAIVVPLVIGQLSALAGLFNQHSLQTRKASLSLHTQNFVMYACGFGVNAATLLWSQPDLLVGTGVFALASSVLWSVGDNLVAWCLIAAPLRLFRGWDGNTVLTALTMVLYGLAVSIVLVYCSLRLHFPSFASTNQA